MAARELYPEQMMSDRSRRVLLGHIAGAHGIRGDVIVRSFTEDPGAIGDYGALYLEDGSKAFDLTVKRVTNKGVIARVKGVEDRNGAEALRGTQLFVTREQLGDADDGSFFHTDLIGLSAVDPDGKTLGKVMSVENFGAGDLLEIRFSGAKQTEYIAFTHEFVPEVDIDGGRVVVVIPENTGEDGDEGKSEKN